MTDQPATAIAIPPGSGAEAARFRRFGLELGFVLLLIALWPYARHGATPSMTLVAIGAALAGLGLLAPLSLRLPHILWMGFGRLLGRITTPLLLGLLYFFVVAPLGFVARLLGRDRLGLVFDRSAASYRENRLKGSSTDLERSY